MGVGECVNKESPEENRLVVRSGIENAKPVAKEQRREKQDHYRVSIFLMSH